MKRELLKKTKKMFTLASCIAMTLAISTGCEDEPMPIKPIPPEPPQEYVILKFGDTVVIPNSNMKISFDDVNGDFRRTIGAINTSLNPGVARVNFSIQSVFSEGTEIAKIVLFSDGMHLPCDYELLYDVKFDVNDLSNWNFYGRTYNTFYWPNIPLYLDTLGYTFAVVGLVPYPDFCGSIYTPLFLKENKDVYTAKIYFKKLEEKEI